MEVVKPSSSIMGFDFNSARSSPRSSAPSTPRRFGECYFSAPTSPTRMSEFYGEFDRLSMMMVNDRQSSSLAVPFDWEEKPGTPKLSLGAATRIDDDDDDDDFAFDFNRSPLAKTYQMSAEELFDGGKIKPLKPPPRLQVDEINQKSPLLSSPSPRSSRSPLSQGKKIIEAFSPRKKKDQEVATAIETSRNGRGRERIQDLTSKNSSRRATRSLSPYRVSEYPWEEEKEKKKHHHDQATSSSSSKQSSLNSKPSFSSSSNSKGSSRKWRLRDFLLFRSASEGHATDNKDPFRKYNSSGLPRKLPEDNKNPSVKSKRKVSAHELHYTTNKAASENMKKKTFLPYKQGILGRLAFSPAVHAPFQWMRST